MTKIKAGKKKLEDCPSGAVGFVFTWGRGERERERERERENDGKDPCTKHVCSRSKNLSTHSSITHGHNQLGKCAPPTTK